MEPSLPKPKDVYTHNKQQTYNILKNVEQNKLEGELGEKLGPSSKI
jgi:hypothetical protein